MLFAVHPFKSDWRLHLPVKDKVLVVNTDTFGVGWINFNPLDPPRGVVRKGQGFVIKDATLHCPSLVIDTTSLQFRGKSRGIFSVSYMVLKNGLGFALDYTLVGENCKRIAAGVLDDVDLVDVSMFEHRILYVFKLGNFLFVRWSLFYNSKFPPYRRYLYGTIVFENDELVGSFIEPYKYSIVTNELFPLEVYVANDLILSNSLLGRLQILPY